MFANLKRRETSTINTFLNDYIQGSLTSIYDDTITVLPGDLLSGVGMSRITCPNVTKIESRALYNCGALQSVSFPKCSYIGESAFYGTGNTYESYFKITFPNCTYVGPWAFYNARFQEIAFPKLERIESNAFNYCYLLSKVYFPNVIDIGSYAFYYCYNVTSMSFPKLKTLSGPYAFYGCYGMSYLDLNTVETIDNAAYCFAGMSGMKSIGLRKLKTINNSPSLFSYCPSLSYIELPALESVVTTWTSPFYSMSATKISVPKLSLNVSHIFESAYYLQSIYFKPSSSINIAYAAFSYCPRLTTLLNVGPADLYSISSYAFYSNYKLRDIQLEGVKYIGQYAFAYCSALENLDFKSGVLSAEADAFRGCIGLKTVKGTILNSLTMSIFYNCANLKTVSLKGCNVVENGAFAECGQLETVDLENCFNLGAYVFSNCGKLSNINLPYVSIINSSAFHKCSALSSISFPKCSILYPGAFMQCNSLEKVTLGNSIFSIPGAYSYSASDWTEYHSYSAAFYHCDNLKVINLPNVSSINGELMAGLMYSTFNIEELTFTNCKTFTTLLPRSGSATFTTPVALKNLRYIDLTNCETIGSYAFYYNLNYYNHRYSGYNQNLTELNLPKCKEIGSFAFYAWFRGLKSVYLPAIEHIGSDAFVRCYPGSEYVNIDPSISRTFILSGQTVCSIDSLVEFADWKTTSTGYTYTWDNVYILVPNNLWSEYITRYSSYKFCSKILKIGDNT